MREDLVAPVVDAGVADTFFCNLDTLLLRGTAISGVDTDVEYSWSSAAGFATLPVGDPLSTAVLFPDLYRLRAVNTRNACVGEDSVVVARDVMAPLVEAGQDSTLTCTRTALRLNGSFTSRSGQAAINWTSILGQDLGLPARLDPVVSEAAAYQLVITDPQNNCRGADVVCVTQDTLTPMPQVSVTDNVAPLLNCNQRELLLQGLGTIAAEPELIRWSVDGNALGSTRIQRANKAGVYQVVITNQRNSCRGRDSLIITEDFSKPKVLVETPPTLSCTRDSVRLRAVNSAGYTQLWRDSLGSLIAVGAGPWVAAPGIYSVSTRSTANGCIDTTDVRVLTDYREPRVSIDVPDVLDCDTKEVLLNATGSDRGSSFVGVWSSMAGGSPVANLPYQYRATQPGRYRFTLADLRNGCQRTESVIVERSAVAIDSIEYTARGPVCPGETDGLIEIRSVAGGQAPFRFRLDGGLLTGRQLYENLLPGSYTVAAVGVDGCEVMTDIELPAAAPPTVDLRSDTLILLGDSVQLNYSTSFPEGTYQARWRPVGGVVTDTSVTAIWVAPTDNKTYELEVVGPGGCSAVGTVQVEVDGRIDYYVPNAFSPNGDATNDLFRPYVGPQVAAIENFTVYDRWGALVYEERKGASDRTAIWGWDGNLKGRPLQPGQFAWRLELRLLDGSRLTKFGSVSLLR